LHWTAATNGHADVLEVLATDFGLTTDDALIGYNEAFKCAAKNGHARVLMVLRRDFMLTGNLVKYDYKFAFRCAAKYGYVQVLKVMATEYRFNIHNALDAHLDIDYALSKAIKKGHIDVLNFLKNEWGLEDSSEVIKKIEAAFCK